MVVWGRVGESVSGIIPDARVCAYEVVLDDKINIMGDQRKLLLPEMAMIRLLEAMTRDC